MTTSKCTVGLLILASQTAYRINKNNFIEHDTVNAIKEKGYEIIIPQESEVTGKTRLAAVCLAPEKSDTVSPIIISFRGTATGWDAGSDFTLGIFGVVEKKFRDEAFKFYNEVREKYPDREIILTGHSLGGHLAQYVAAKAYSTNSDLVSKSLVQVRTFNTAPIKTSHSDVVTDNALLLNQFVNYRTSTDIVSDLPLQKYLGNTFVFPCSKNPIKAHLMGAMENSLPPEIKEQIVGGGAALRDQQKNCLIESIRGFRYSYQCRVDGQFFSKWRAGSKNSKELETALPDINNDIMADKYDAAIFKLKNLRGRLYGKVSTALVDSIINRTEINRTEKEKEKGLSNQLNIKMALQGLKKKPVSEKNQADEDKTATVIPPENNGCQK